MYSNLPEDIIEKILLFVPVKSLIRFKLVQKFWLALISDPNFLVKNLHQRSKFKNKDIHILLEYRSKKQRHDFIYSFLSYDTLEVSSTGLLPYPDLPWELPSIESFINIRIVGVCNGVVCLNDNFDLFTVLWSPASRDVNVLPPCPQKNRRDDDRRLSKTTGFGFDITSNAFKVVKILTCHGTHEQAESHHKVLIYTSKTNSWKEIYPKIPFFELYGDRYTLASNGFVSWPGYVLKHNGSGCREIISFDISNEVFKTTEMPRSQTVGHDVVYSNLVMLDGHIALVTHNHSSNHRDMPTPPFNFDVWVLLELGVKESWTKLFAIQTLGRLGNPLGFWKNGETFAINEDFAAVLDNNSGQQLRTIQIDAARCTSSICTYDGEIAREPNDKNI